MEGSKAQFSEDFVGHVKEHAPYSRAKGNL